VPSSSKHDYPHFSKLGASMRRLLCFGHEIATLVNEELKPGSYEVAWEALGFSSGVYFYRLQAGEFKDVKKLMLVRLYQFDLTVKRVSILDPPS
jgi:hypothetical protein